MTRKEKTTTTTAPACPNCGASKSAAATRQANGAEMVQCGCGYVFEAKPLEKA
jgi:rubredoxin